MAYPALHVRAPNVGGAFLGGMEQGQQMQARNMLLQQQQAQQQRDDQFRNILAQSVGPMAASAAAPPGAQPQGMQPPAGDPADTANYLNQATANPLGGPAPEQMNQLLALDPERAMQLAQLFDQQRQQQQAQLREEASQRVRGAQFVLKSKDPKRTLEIGFPDIVENLKQHGHDFDSLSDEDVKLMAQDVLTHYGPIAGVGPASDGESPFAKINPSDYTQESVKAFESSGNMGDLVAKTKPGDDPTDKLFTRAGNLRKEYEGKKEGLETIRSAFANVESAEPNDAGDTQLVLNYMRVISPGIRIQPGERIDDAASVPGIPQAAIGLWNKVVGGGKLNGGQRAEIRSQAKRTFDTQTKLAADLRPRYERLARDAGVDPWQVIGDESGGQVGGSGGGGGGSGAAPKPGAVEDGYRFKGGDPADQKNWEPVR
jgi:hypothetical protein